MLKNRSVYQFSANQKEWNKTNSLQAVKQALLKGRKITFDSHDASKMATLQVKNREKLPHGIMGRLHNPRFTLAEYNLQPNKAKHSWTKLRMSRPLFVGSYLQLTWWALGQWKGRKKNLIWMIMCNVIPETWEGSCRFQFPRRLKRSYPVQTVFSLTQIPSTERSKKKKL